MVDVGVSVGIVPDNSGARVIKASLDEISKESAKADAAAQKLANTQTRLAAQTTVAQAAATRAAAATASAGNAMQAAEQKAAKLVVQNTAIAVAAARVAAAEKAAAAATLQAANAMQAAEQKAAKLAIAQNSLNNSTSALSNVFGKLQAIFAGLTIAQAIRETVKYSDTYKNLESRLKLVTNSSYELAQVQERLFRISQETSTPLEGNIAAYTRLSNSLTEYQKGTVDIVRLSELLSKTLKISGADAAGAATFYTQFGQAASSDFKAIGQELQTFADQNPRLYGILRDEAAKTGTTLKKMAADGELSFDLIAKAVLNAGDKIDAEADQITLTVGRAFTQLDNAFLKYIGQSDAAKNSTSSIALAVSGLAENFDTVAKTILIVVGALTIQYIPALIAVGVRAYEAVAAQVALTGAMAGIAAATAAASAVFAATAIVIYSIVTPTEQAAKATADYSARMAKFTEYQHEFTTASANRREAIIADVKSNIAMYIAEQQSLLNLAKQYAQTSSLKVGAMAVAARVNDNIYVPLGLSTPSKNSPDEVLAKVQANAKNIQETQKILDGLENYKPSKPIIGGNTKKPKLSEAEKQAKKDQTELEAAINGSRTEMEKLNDEVARLEKLKGVAKTTSDVELLNRGIRNTQDEIEKLRVKGELDSPLVKTFKDVADEIQDGFKDAFKGAFDGGGSLFEKFASGVKKTFKSLLLDLAYQSAVKPIIVSVLGVAGGVLGISGGALNSVLGTSGGAAGASGASGLGSLSSIASSLLSGGLYSNTLAGIGTGIGNSLFGNAAFIGPGATSNAAAALGSGFGNLGYGAIGGLAASLFGLGNKNPIVSGISGGAGSLIGGAFGGPLGAAIGGFAGTALSGLFGGKKPTDATAEAVIDFKNPGAVRRGDLGSKTTQQNRDYREAILKQITDTLSLVGQYGGSSSGGGGYIQVGNRDGLRYQGRNYGTNSTAFQTAIFSDLKNSITGLTGTFKTIFDKVGTGDLSGLGSAFEFGASYDSILKSGGDPAKDTAEQLAAAIKTLDDTMAGLIQTASNLGLPIDQYTAALQKQKDVAIGALKAQQAGFSSLADMTRAFDNFFNGQALGDSSSLTPQQKLEAAQSNFGSLLKKAQGGDLSVTQDLLASAQTLIGQGRDVYASSVDYSNLEGFVRSSVKGVATQAGYSGQDVTYSIVSTNQKLIETGANTNTAIDSMKAEIFRLSNLLQSYITNVA